MTIVTDMTRTIRLAAACALLAILAACSAPKFKTDYVVNVTFTPAAAARLKADGLPAQLEAYYYGAPIDAVKEKANEQGQVELGLDQVSIDPATPTVTVKGDGFDLAHRDKVVDGKVTVQLRVYSQTAAPNDLKCTTVTAALSDIQAKAPTISCDAA